MPYHTNKHKTKQTRKITKEKLVVMTCISINLETLAPHCTIMKKKIKQLTNQLDIRAKCYMEVVYFEKMLIYIVFS